MTTTINNLHFMFSVSPAETQDPCGYICYNYFQLTDEETTAQTSTLGKAILPVHGRNKSQKLSNSAGHSGAHL